MIRRSHGFSMVELLLVTVIVSVLTAATMILLDPARAMFQVQPEMADVQQRARVGIDALGRDLVAAGAGLDWGLAAGPLVRSLPPVVPYRIGTNGGDPPRGVFFRPDVVTVMYVPLNGAQCRLRDAMTDGLAPLVVEPVPGSPPGDPVCGFAPGDQAVVLDRHGRWDVLRVTDTIPSLGWLVHADDRLTNWYEAGSPIASLSTRTYWVRRNAGEASLYRYDGYKTEAEITDRVADFLVEYFGDPDPPQSPAPPDVGVDDTADTWPAGENCLFGRDALTGEVRARLPRLSEDDGSLAHLTPSMLADGPWCPDAAAANRFDADALRIRRVRVTLRISSPLGRLVPHRTVRLDVSPRNLNLGR